MSNKIKNLLNQKFNRLKVIKLVGVDNRHNSLWLCVCDCGKEKIVKGYRLKNKATKSCGCIVAENNRKNLKKIHELGLNDHGRIEFGESNFNYLYGRYAREAAERKLLFLLSRDEFKNLTSKNCYYCGLPPKQIVREKYHYGEYFYNGIDRADNDVGYTIENCVTSCGFCNRSKRKLSQKEFLENIKRIYDYQKLKNLTTIQD